MGEPRSELARAKVNLALCVTGRRAHGYHELDSLVVFPELGDVITAEAAGTLSLTLEGPFGAELGAGPENLVLRAAEMLAGGKRGVALHLTKALPVASGIGGGSADAAAALRLLSRLWRVPLPDLGALARLGADVPVCVHSRAARIQGIGDRLEPLDLPGFWLVLCNPGQKLQTGRVFAGLRTIRGTRLEPARPPETLDGLVTWLFGQRNDLEDPAVGLAPAIADVLRAMRAQSGCRIARMSGSGATCFGLFAGEAAAIAASEAIRKAEPRWWTVAGPVFRRPPHSGPEEGLPRPVPEGLPGEA